MSRLWQIVLACGVLSLSSSSAAGELDWLLGCWVAPDGSEQEVWVADGDGRLLGFGVAVSNDRVGFYELLSIAPGQDGVLVYTAHPKGQASTSFAAADIEPNKARFVNPDHDFPQEIRYAREGNALRATISLLGGREPRTFEKVACR